jgi:gluconokinase
MPPDLLASQFRTLEPPGDDEHPITVSIEATVDAIVDNIVRHLNAGAADHGASTGDRP